MSGRDVMGEGGRSGVNGGGMQAEREGWREEGRVGTDGGMGEGRGDLDCGESEVDMWERM